MRYYKLVRDLVPEILKAKGINSVVHVATDAEYEEKLREKLTEEVEEFLLTPNADEMADVLEVLEAFQEHKGMTFDEVLAAKQKKALNRGTFSKRMILETTTEGSDGY